MHLLLAHRAPQPIDDGTLEFLGSDGSVLVTLVLQGVQVTDLYYAPSRSGGPKPAVVGIVARLARLEFAPAMAH